jgi:hypothetical protein
MVNNFLKTQANSLEKSLHEKGFTHLYVAIKGNHLIVYSKDGTEKINRARLSYLQNTFYLHMADHTGRWEPTPYEGDLTEIIKMLTEDFSFALIDFNEFM